MRTGCRRGVRGLWRYGAVSWLWRKTKRGGDLRFLELLREWAYWACFDLGS
ncbi:hypothetical protein F383_34948 [Gossypium arboreum]|uniref:Uncharacterized protein n=1 Tax=Gossypium arboreum TaxID=29729 RepID=A0A0B0PYL2_GOSAR|nr:hypothetical protein F383_34948 [Gossypium arboreum]